MNSVAYLGKNNFSKHGATLAHANGGHMERIAYFGIDVHKDTNTMFMFAQTDDGIIEYEIGTIEAGSEFAIKAIKKTIKAFELQDYEVQAGYEAGPTGYGLCKAIQKAGYKCDVMAPTTIKKAPGERTKTDRRDAKMLAMALATDTYKPVYLLNDEDLATREFTRTRNTRKKELKKAKQFLLSFLLRLGKTYPDSGNYWTQKHWDWLDTLHFDDRFLEYSLRAYIQDIRDIEAKIEMMDKMIEDIAFSERYKEKVSKLMCFTGIETYTALSIVCEIGDFSRFPDAKSFSSYIGLVPGQYSSGQRQRYTTLTKTGNARVRTLLIEATKGIKRSSIYNKSNRLIERQTGQSPEIIAYADKCRKRIKVKMDCLENRRGKNANVSTAAGARELACFIWGMMTGNVA